MGPMLEVVAQESSFFSVLHQASASPLSTYTITELAAVALLDLFHVFRKGVSAQIFHRKHPI